MGRTATNFDSVGLVNSGDERRTLLVFPKDASVVLG